MSFSAYLLIWIGLTIGNFFYQYIDYKNYERAIDVSFSQLIAILACFVVNYLK
jgi:hypothetical protein